MYFSRTELGRGSILGWGSIPKSALVPRLSAVAAPESLSAGIYFLELQERFNVPNDSKYKIYPHGWLACMAWTIYGKNWSCDSDWPIDGASAKRKKKKEKKSCGAFQNTVTLASTIKKCCKHGQTPISFCAQITLVLSSIASKFSWDDLWGRPFNLALMWVGKFLFVLPVLVAN